MLKNFQQDPNNADLSPMYLDMAGLESKYGSGKVARLGPNNYQRYDNDGGLQPIYDGPYWRHTSGAPGQQQSMSLYDPRSGSYMPNTGIRSWYDPVANAGRTGAEADNGDAGSGGYWARDGQQEPGAVAMDESGEDPILNIGGGLMMAGASALTGGGALGALGREFSIPFLAGTPMNEWGGSPTLDPTGLSPQDMNGYNFFNNQSPLQQYASNVGDSMSDVGPSGDTSGGEPDWDRLAQDMGDASSDRLNVNDSIGNAARDLAGPASASSGSGVLDTLKSAGKFAQENPVLTGAGLGLGLGGLQAFQASRNAKAANNLTQQQIAAQQARQAQQDNPPAYSGMGGDGLKAPSRTFNPIDLAGLKNYGAGAEHRFFNARGGLPMSGSLKQTGGAFDRMVAGHGGGQDDTIPAMLSPSEYVLDADTVAALGDGNPDHGAKKLDAFRERLRAHKRSAPKSKIPPKARSLESYMGRG